MTLISEYWRDQEYRYGRDDAARPRRPVCICDLIDTITGERDPHPDCTAHGDDE